MSSETTVTVGDQEVQITETEDGFEATPVEEEPDVEGPFLFGQCSSGMHGLKVPLDGEFVVEKQDAPFHEFVVAWNTDQDISDMRSDGSPLSEDLAVEHGLDGYASVDELEIVEE